MTINLNIITWNARGIKNKSLELFDFLLSNEIRICLLSETWLKPANNLNHPQFKIYRNDRISTRGGGVAIIIRNNISHSTIPLLMHLL